MLFNEAAIFQIYTR